MVKLFLSSNSGSGGNSLLSIPMTLNTDPRVLMVAFGVSEVSTLTSISANSLIIRPNSLTGKVTEPPSSTSAFTEHLAPKSKLVVVK